MMSRHLIAAAMMTATPALAQGGGLAQPTVRAPALALASVSITVPDIDATIAFYAKAVPFPVVKRYKVKGSTFPRAMLASAHKEVEIALIAMPTGMIQLMDFEPGKPAAPKVRPIIGPGYTHICFQSPSSDPAIKRFMAAGLRVISRFGKPDGVDIGGYGVRYAYGTDPNGIMIENESLDAPKRNEAAWITHIANTVHDRDRMLDFYAKVFGIKAHRTIERDNNPRLDDVANIDGLSIKGGWIRLSNMEIEVWEYVQPRTPAPQGDRKLDEVGYNSFAVDVENVTIESARIKGLGVRLVGKPIAINGMRMQYAYDPEGNLFSLVSRADQAP
jgi:catechol 2,3-dioxygenase-like lactoylglutathione lyase family enzyme